MFYVIVFFGLLLGSMHYKNIKGSGYLRWEYLCLPGHPLLDLLAVMLAEKEYKCMWAWKFFLPPRFSLGRVCVAAGVSLVSLGLLPVEGAPEASFPQQMCLPQKLKGKKKFLPNHPYA